MGNETLREQGRHYERVETALQWPMMALTLLFLVALVVPLQAGIGPGIASVCRLAETAIWFVFAAEYLLLLVLARNRRLFVRTHILDLLIVVFPALRVTRVARLARLGRLGSVLRLPLLAASAARGARRASEVFAQYRLGYIAAVVVILLLLFTGLMLIAERDVNPDLNTYFRCLWWGVVTMTTVGYGDAAPVSVAGRVFAIVFMLIGIGLAGVATATIASVFIGIERRDDAEELQRRLETLEQGIAQLQAQLTQLAAQTDLNKAS